MPAPRTKKHRRLFMAFAYIMLAWVIPLIISIGRILSSAGSAAFVFPKFMDFATSWNPSPHNNSAIPANSTTTHHTGCADSSSDQECLTGWGIASAITMMIFNIILNVMTRAPVTFSAFRSQYRSLKNKNNPDEDAVSNNDESTSYFDFQGMTTSSAVIYAGLKTVNVASGAFAGLSTYLSIKSLGEFLEHCLIHTNIGEDHPGIRIALYESAAIFFTVSSICNHFNFNIKTGDENAKALAIKLTSGSCPRVDCASVATVILSSPATMCVGPMAFFTTFHALDKICWITMPTSLHYTISGVSYFTSTTARILTDPPCMYQMINAAFHPDTHTAVSYSSCQTIPYKAIVYSAGIGDSAGTALSNFTGFINTVKLLTPIDQHHPALLAAAGVCALSASGLNFSFGVHNGAKKGMALFFRAKPANDGYQAGSQVSALSDPAIEDVEAGNIHANTVFEFPPQSQPIDIPDDDTDRIYLSASV